MNVLVTGASGFVGSQLVPSLQRSGHEVRAYGRDAERVRAVLSQTHAAPVEIVEGDLLTGAGLRQALEGVQVAYYLVHSMERVGGRSTSFPEREHLAVTNFATAATRAGVRRAIYLGGLVPRAQALERTDSRISRHLSSRREVERILLAELPDSLALRASIVIGARSRSFRLLVRLVERMPVMTLPAWRRNRTAPIDERDVIAMLTAAATAPQVNGSLDVGGPDVLTYGEMIERIAELMIVGRHSLRLGVNLTPIAARVAAAIAGEDPELVLPLMEGLAGDLLPADDRVAARLGVRLHSFDAAVEHALGEWERHEPLAAR